MLLTATFATVPPGLTPQRQASPREGRLPPQALQDYELQAATNALLAAVNPAHPQNRYFSAFARDRLRWIGAEHAAGRLAIAFLKDGEDYHLPGDVRMASARIDGEERIFLSKSRFASDLRRYGRVGPTIPVQLKNDFALGLIHEALHLQSTAANPIDDDARAREEMRIWLAVTLHVVRPWRALHQPMEQVFLDVDDAFRRCRDTVPCPELARLVRLVM